MSKQVAQRRRTVTRRRAQPEPTPDAIRILSYAYDVLRGTKPNGKPLTADEWTLAERLVEQIAVPQ